jgi:predicted HAD superfamily phosphohydrolase YqeG
MITIKRVANDKYRLTDTDDNLIAEYDQKRMKHPHDWIEDVKDAGYEIRFASEWEFVDSR